MEMARNSVPSKKGTKVPASSGKKISDVEWEIPAEGEMKVPGRIFASA